MPTGFHRFQKKEKLIGTVGYNIYRMREKFNMTIRCLAEKAQVNNNSIRRIERGEIRASLRMLAKLANALGCSLADLLANVDNP